MGESRALRILTAVGLSAALVGVRGFGPAAVVCLYLAAVSLPLVVVDVRERRLPNALVLPGFVFAAVGGVWESLARGSPEGAAGRVVVALGVMGVLAVPAIAGGLGMGDVKLAGLLAIAIGGSAAGAGVPAGGVVVWLGAAFATLVVVAVVERLAGVRPAGREVAFGPIMLGAFWPVAVLW